MMITVVDALVIPMADGGPDWFHGWLRIDDDGRISELGPGVPPPGPGPVLDLGGAMVAPGFVSAHSHLFTSGLRGIAPGSSLYPWVRAMMEVFRHADAETLYWSTLHGALDFLANGVTSAYNFTQSRVTWLYDPATARNTLGGVHPPEYLTRQFDGTADAGIRAVHAIRLDDEAAPAARRLRGGRPPLAVHRAGLGRPRDLRAGVRPAQPPAGVRGRAAGQRRRPLHVAARGLGRRGARGTDHRRGRKGRAVARSG
jgi:cytosine/adenosine deaminase-related metal-dependent hydrolase